jgi:asparagine synthase (glutamine-hydrolysing)
MCGIAGLARSGGAPAGPETQGTVARMLDSLAHRGPDDHGLWSAGEVALGHRRLSIIDLSPLGHQPMMSPSGRYVISYNGEIYNFEELRATFAHSVHLFRGNSDTEVLLALIERDGLSHAVEQCVGMFAFALFDRKLRRLYLVRDRYGEKPLYFGWCGEDLVFASEVKAISVLPNFSTRVSGEAVRSVLARGYIEPDASIYEDVAQVAPGTIMGWNLASLTPRSEPDIRERYWRPKAAREPSSVGAFRGRYADARDQLRTLLEQSVAQQLRADVPVGSFLSGGIDSSLVTALMTRVGRGQVRTYSIGFEQPALNEADLAQAVAAHLGTSHTEWYVTEQEAVDLVPSLNSFYDEPLADPSQIPTLILARLVRRDVSVALSGDGADELFGGYPHYRHGAALWARRTLRLQGCMLAVADDFLAPAARALLPRPFRDRLPWHSLGAGRSLYSAPTRALFIRRLKDLNRAADAYLSPDLARGSQDSRTAWEHLSYCHAAMLADIESYLPGDILVKVDRATMAASLESRAPFLDHRVGEFADTLPESFIFNGGSGKHILRDLLYQMVPQHLVDRPKSGFNPPLGNWLRGGLRDWAHDLLLSARVADILNVNNSRKLLETHIEGRFDLSSRVWPLLTVAAWADRRNCGRSQ